MQVEGRRALLNLPGFHSTAAIVAEVTHDRYGTNANVRISDCARGVNLEFYPAQAEYHENDLYKVDQMIDALRVFRRALVKAQKKHQ